MKNHFWLPFLLVITYPCLSTGQDSSRQLGFESFLQQVKQYHPAAQRAFLEKEKAAQNIRQARGAFDPLLQFSYHNKDYREKNYYDLLSAELKLPTRFGVGLKAGYDRTSGLFLNPENSLPPGGLTYAGLSLPLGQGLLIDQERATLRQALIDAQAAALRQTAQLNDLLLDAAHAYWRWYAAWQEWQIFRQALDLAQQRYLATVESFRLGDRPALDTLEALLQVQTRQIDLAETILQLQKSWLALQNFFWNVNYLPAPPPDTLTPAGATSTLATQDPTAIWQQYQPDLTASHPLLQLYSLKIETLMVERRWKQEKLKPRLDLQYNLLAEPAGNSFWEDTGFTNAKWGVDFKFPLFLRTERSGVQLTILKLKDINLEIVQKEQTIRTKAEALAAEWQNLSAQLAIVDNAVNNYRQLLQAEQQLFNLGESTVFLVNARENKLVEAQVKQVAVETKRRVAQAELLYVLGVLASLF